MTDENSIELPANRPIRTAVGAVVAVLLSLAAAKLFAAMDWPGRFYAQWTVFYATMMATNGLAAVRAKPVQLIALYLGSALLTGWLTTSFSR